jgi:hypothetical protein
LHFIPFRLFDDGMGHAVRLGADAKLEVVRSSPPEHVDRLRRTVERLRAATGTGAVEIVSATDDGERVELVLAFAGRPPTAPMRGAELAPIAFAVSAALADLHARRLAHGAVEIDHVLVDAGGSVRLCGFGADDGSNAGDVLAFGELVRSLLDPDDVSTAAETLRAVAVRCTVDDDASRPTMAAVTTTLAGAGDRPRAIRPSLSPEEPSRRRWPVVAATALVLVIALVTVLPRGARAELSVATTTTMAPTTTTTHPWPSARAVHVAGDTWRFDGDGVTLLGRWSCTDELPVIVRPDGTVWIVDALPSGDDVTARYVTTVAGATGAHVASMARGCDDLVVETADGPIRPALGA